MNVLEMMTEESGITIPYNDSGKRIPDICGTKHWQRDNLTPNTRYACCMIPIPEGYRLATEDDRKGAKPAGYSHRSNVTNCWLDGRSIGGKQWDADKLYAVPIKSAKDTKIEALQARLKDAEAEVAKVRGELGEIG